MSKKIFSMAEVVKTANILIAQNEDATEKDILYRDYEVIEEFYDMVISSEIIMALESKSLGIRVLVEVLKDLGEALQENSNMCTNSKQHHNRTSIIPQLIPTLINFTESDDYSKIEAIRKSSVNLPFVTGQVTLQKVLEGTTLHEPRRKFTEYTSVPALDRLVGLTDKLSGCTDPLVVRYLITPPLLLVDLLNEKIAVKEAMSILDTVRNLNSSQEEKSVFSNLRIAADLFTRYGSEFMALLNSKNGYSKVMEIKNSTVLFGSDKFGKAGVYHFELPKVLSVELGKETSIDHVAPNSAIQNSSVFK